MRPDVGHSEPSCGVKINATSCLLDILTAGLPSWRRVASLSLGPSVPWRAYAPATRSPRHQNGCEAEPGTCWGMLRANHFVNRHEQGVRTMGRAGRAHSGTAGLRQNRGGQKFAALVVRIRGEFGLGRGTAQKRVTGGRWRRIELGDLLAGQVVELRGSPRLWP